MADPEVADPEVADPEVTPVLLFPGYFLIDGHPTRTRITRITEAMPLQVWSVQWEAELKVLTFVIVSWISRSLSVPS